MLISLNIILDSINHYKYDVYIELPTDKAFRRISLMPHEMSHAQPDCLYVCQLSQAMRVKNQIPDLYCLCLRDRIQDSRETAEQLAGMIIINENLELEQLYYEVQDMFVLVDDWYENMQDAIITQKTMQDIISMSESVIGNFISVSDSALALIAYTKNIPTDDPTSLFLIKHKYHSEESIKAFKKYNRFEQWMNSDGLIISTDGFITKYDVVSKVFTFDETYFTHVVMTTTHRQITPGLLDLFNYLIDALSHYIKRNWEERKNYSHVYSSLIVDLMEGAITESDTMSDRARIVGIKPDDEYIVMLLTGGNKGKSIFPGLMSQDIVSMFSRIRPVYYNCRLILFLHHADIANYLIDQELENKLNAYFQENNVYCGMSEIFDDLLQLPEAYRQAELALQESDSNYQNGYIIWEGAPKLSNIAQFSTYYASCLLDKSEKNEKLWRNSKYGKMLLELYTSDLGKNTNNLEVLYTYLSNERRATETAKCLHMHRNNVVYRVRRIEEILKVSLDDEVTRLNLTMSFIMLKYSGFIQDYNSSSDKRNIIEI